jgi:nucleoid-associated protein YgaU
MGFMDKFKGIIGGNSKPEVETVKGPSRVLREAGIDPSDLDCQVAADGTLTVSGSCASGEERARVIAVLSEMPNVSRVVNEINVAAPEPEAEARPATEPPAEASEGAAPGAASGRSYTVQPGDTLWKISTEMYGEGSKYMKIFEANSDTLENPDKIYPGQELVIPDLDD